MKKTILATAIAAGLGFSMNANAIVVAPSGVGEALLVPYYSAVNGNKTFLNITNSEPTAKAVKVRFREGVGSRDVLDFTLYLSAYDTWSAVVLTSGDRVTLATQDSSCTVPDVGVGKASFSTTRIPADYQGNVLNRISEGHIEILEMAVLAAGGPLANAVTHVDGVPADCAAISSFSKAMAQKGFPASVIVGPDKEVDGQKFMMPTGGLYAHAAVFNPNDGTYFTYASDALEGWAEGVLWFPQSSGGVAGLSPYTMDQGLAWDEGVDDSGLVEYFDLPDLSTPAIAANGATKATYTATKAYISDTNKKMILATVAYADLDLSPVGSGLLGSTAALGKTVMVTNALLHDALLNDYITSGGYETEWLVTFSTRYLHVNVNNPLAPKLTAILPFHQVEHSVTGEACEEIKFEYWDREENQVVDPGDIEFSPGGSVPNRFQLCYEVNVLAFNQTAGANSAVLGSTEIAKYIGLADGYTDGWAKLDFKGFATHTGWKGMPGTGFMAVAELSGAIPRGATFRHHQRDNHVPLDFKP